MDHGLTSPEVNRSVRTLDVVVEDDVHCLAETDVGAGDGDGLGAGSGPEASTGDDASLPLQAVKKQSAIKLARR